MIYNLIIYCVVTKFKVIRVVKRTRILEASVCIMAHEGVLVVFSFQVRLSEMTSVLSAPREAENSERD